MFKLFGAAGSKFTFSIEVHDVVLPDMLDHFDGTESLCVSFERKNKPPVFTQDKSVLLNRMDEITATFKETLKVDTTLYKDSKTGLYKEKMGKLTVLQRKRGVAGVNSKDAFKTIGVAMIPMHEVVVDDDGKPSTESHDLQINLLWCMSENAYINITVSAVDKDSLSETGSVNTEDHDEEGAVNSSYNANLNNSMSSFGSSNSNSNGSGISAARTKSPTSMFAPVNPPIKEEEEYEDGGGGGRTGKGSLGIASSRSSNDAIRKSMTSKLPPSGKQPFSSTNDNDDTYYGGGSSTSTPLKKGGVTFSADYSSSSSAAAAATPGAAAGGASRSVIKGSSGPSSTPSRVFLSPEDKKFEASQMYTEMRQKIENLEAAVLASEEIVAYERNKAAEAVSSSNNNAKISSQYLTDLQNELQASREENKKLKELLEEFNSSNNRTSGEMSRLQAQLSKAADEIDFLMAERDKFEKASQDAAKDNEALIADLIQQKVVNGNLATDLEETKLELHNLKARVDAFNAKRAANGQPTANLGTGGGQGPKMSLDQRLAEHQQRVQSSGAGGPAVGGSAQNNRRSVDSFATPSRQNDNFNGNNNNGGYNQQGGYPNTAPQQRVNPMNGGNPSNNNSISSNANYSSNQNLGIKKVNPFAGNNNSSGGGGAGGMMSGLLRGFDSLTGGDGSGNNANNNGGMMRGFGGSSNNNGNNNSNGGGAGGGGGNRGNQGGGGGGYGNSNNNNNNFNNYMPGSNTNNNNYNPNNNYNNFNPNNNGPNSYRPSNNSSSNNNNSRNYNNNYDDNY